MAYIEAPKEIKAQFDWDEYYMWMAVAAAVKSKDPRSKVGAVVVKGSSIVTGYNGFPRGVKDYENRWERPIKYGYVAHAERNALDNAHFDVSGGTIYVTHYPPCNECAKTIIQRGITRVVCGNWILSPETLEQSKASVHMLKEAGVRVSQLNSSQIYNKALSIVQGFIDAARTS